MAPSYGSGADVTLGGGCHCGCDSFRSRRAVSLNTRSNKIQHIVSAAMVEVMEIQCNYHDDRKTYLQKRRHCSYCCLLSPILFLPVNSCSTQICLQEGATLFPRQCLQNKVNNSMDQSRHQLPGRTFSHFSLSQSWGLGTGYATGEPTHLLLFLPGGVNSIQGALEFLSGQDPEGRSLSFWQLTPVRRCRVT